MMADFHVTTRKGEEHTLEGVDGWRLMELLRDYKQLIDDGFALPYGEALDHESRTSQEHMRTLTPAAVAERRAGIQRRGRAQSDG